MPMRGSRRHRRKKALIKRDGRICWTENCRNRENLTIDHIVATRDGGSDDMENLRLLCHPCHAKQDNMKKGGYHPDTGQLSADFIANSRRYKRLRGE